MSKSGGGGRTPNDQRSDATNSTGREYNVSVDNRSHQIQVNKKRSTSDGDNHE
jgi:hypothetical protein